MKLTYRELLPPSTVESINKLLANVPDGGADSATQLTDYLGIVIGEDDYEYGNEPNISDTFAPQMKAVAGSVLDQFDLKTLCSHIMQLGQKKGLSIVNFSKLRRSDFHRSRAMKGIPYRQQVVSQLMSDIRKMDDSIVEDITVNRRKKAPESYMNTNNRLQNEDNFYVLNARHAHDVNEAFTCSIYYGDAKDTLISKQLPYALEQLAIIQTGDVVVGQIPPGSTLLAAREAAAPFSGNAADSNISDAYNKEYFCDFEDNIIKPNISTVSVSFAKISPHLDPSHQCEIDGVGKLSEEGVQFYSWLRHHDQQVIPLTLHVDNDSYVLKAEWLHLDDSLPPEPSDVPASVKGPIVEVPSSPPDQIQSGASSMSGFFDANESSDWSWNIKLEMKENDSSAGNVPASPASSESSSKQQGPSSRQ